MISRRESKTLDLPTFMRSLGDEVCILVRVQPRTSTVGIQGERNGRLRVGLNSPPVDGKANQELVQMFAKLFKRPKSSVRIVRGEKSREKEIAISGISPEEALLRLSQS